MQVVHGQMDKKEAVKELNLTKRQIDRLII